MSGGVFGALTIASHVLMFVGIWLFANGFVRGVQMGMAAEKGKV